MKNNCISIPCEAITSQEYLSLDYGFRALLIGLYIENYDADRFTIDFDNPIRYGMSKGCNMSFRVRKIVQSGLLIDDGKFPPKSCHQKRVFRFKYPAFN